MTALREFLSNVITTDEGNFLLASGYNGTWKEHWFKWPAQVNEIISTSQKLAAAKQNVYFSAHLFSEQHSTKTNVLDTRTIQADLDSAEVYNLPVKPSYVVETSPGRYQAYWVIQPKDDEEVTSVVVEELSRKLTYAIPDCDRSGWSLGHRVRLPDTFNYKYDNPHPIKVVQTNPRRADLEDINALPDLEPQQKESLDKDNAWIDQLHVEIDVPPTRMMKELADEGKISKRIYRHYNTTSQDRSVELFALCTELLRAGCGRELTYWLAYNSANNKFKDRYNGVKDLRKDILRAESKATKSSLNLKSTIQAIRKNASLGTSGERLDQISALIIRDMSMEGTFVHTKSDSLWYIPKATGRPITITMRGRPITVLLNLKYGINRSNRDFDYILSNLISHVTNLPQTADIQHTCFFDENSDSLYLHLGGRDVLTITKDSLYTAVNGDNDIIFGSRSFQDPIRVDLEHADSQWYRTIFDSSLEFIIVPNKEQARALLACWFLMVLFRSIAATRPILTILGPPGSGKSTLMYLVYKILYGQGRSLADLSSRPDYDLTVANSPMVAFDGLDTFIPWLPNALATSTSITEIEKRELYSDIDLIKIRRTAVVAVTAHNPKFLREDVVDRLLVMQFRRREGGFGYEKELEKRIYSQRPKIWGGIIKDVQRILNTHIPHESEAPPLRMKDFAILGLWFSRALGFEQDFISAITSIQGNQQGLVIEEQSVLVDALTLWLRTQPATEEYVAPSRIWRGIQAALGTNTIQSREFNKAYRNEVVFSRRLMTMQPALRSVFDIESDWSKQTGSRVWRIRKKAEDQD